MTDSTTTPAGSTSTGATTDDKQNVQQPPAGGDGQQQPPAGQQPTAGTGQQPADGQHGDGGKTFTQADLDRIISDRLGKAEQSWQQKQADQNKKIAQALGLAPDEEVDPAKALEQAQTTATQAQERADRAEAKVLAAAAGINPKRVDAFVKLCEISGALKGVDRSDEKAVAAAIKGAVEKGVEEYPEFKGGTLPNASGGDRSGGQQQTVTLEQFKAMDVDERTKLYRENEGLYKQLAAEAKK
ncbi:hypothetical protein [Amycolatopsis thermophila]|uniref:Scaffolding protein n=1 Tax=Amycolatopsis thermophila TaxID=206084 RepID=A0ABU0ESN0_9PSEU|nr:hypothetical protein [Amycolatopsis thermophila]MDQ0377950.1 hypothetical protein [Amycolatopsis thermophila]